MYMTSAAPGIVFQPTEDRYTTPPAPSQHLPPAPEIQITQLSPSKGSADPPTRIQPRSCPAVPDLALRQPVTHLLPKFLEPSYQPIGKRTVLRIPADGSPLQEVHLEILEAPTLRGDDLPVRFPDMREYYPQTAMAHLEYQVVRTSPNEQPEASVGTYIMFMNFAAKWLKLNRNFKRGLRLWGDVFIAKVVENVTIHWGGGATSDELHREVWNGGVTGVMYHNIPWAFMGSPISISGHERRFRASFLVQAIMGLEPVKSHDVIDLGDLRDRRKRLPKVKELPVVEDVEEDLGERAIKEKIARNRSKGKEPIIAKVRAQKKVRFQDENEQATMTNALCEMESTLTNGLNDAKQALLSDTQRNLDGKAPDQTPGESPIDKRIIILKRPQHERLDLIKNSGESESLPNQAEHQGNGRSPLSDKTNQILNGGQDTDQVKIGRNNQTNDSFNVPQDSQQENISPSDCIENGHPIVSDQAKDQTDKVQKLDDNTCQVSIQQQAQAQVALERENHVNGATDIIWEGLKDWYEYDSEDSFFDGDYERLDRRRQHNGRNQAFSDEVDHMLPKRPDRIHDQPNRKDCNSEMSNATRKKPHSNRAPKQNHQRRVSSDSTVQTPANGVPKAPLMRKQIPNTSSQPVGQGRGKFARKNAWQKSKRRQR